MDKRYVDLDEILLALPKEAGKIIRDWPAADVRPVVRGKWEDEWAEAADPHDRRCFRCSSCRTTHAEQTNFCPNCGADMRPQPPKEET